MIRYFDITPLGGDGGSHVTCSVDSDSLTTWTDLGAGGTAKQTHRDNDCNRLLLERHLSRIVSFSE